MFFCSFQGKAILSKVELVSLTSPSVNFCSRERNQAAGVAAAKFEVKMRFNISNKEAGQIQGYGTGNNRSTETGPLAAVRGSL